MSDFTSLGSQLKEELKIKVKLIYSSFEIIASSLNKARLGFLLQSLVSMILTVFLEESQTSLKYLSPQAKALQGKSQAKKHLLTTHSKLTNSNSIYRNSPQAQLVQVTR